MILPISIKKTNSLRLTFLCFCLLSINIGILPATGYYVSKSGDDSNPGTQALPYLTIQKAASSMAAGDTCFIEEGIYEERVIPRSDGLTFKAVSGARVEISGFTRVTDWAVHEGNIYVTQLSWSLGDRNQVFFQDQMMNLARWPNKTNYNPFDLQAAQVTGTNSSLTHPDIPAYTWQNGGKVWFLGKSRWTSWRTPISGSSNGQVSFNQLSDNWQYGGSHSPTRGGEFFLMDVLEALDHEGEWYIAPIDKKLYFYAPGGVDPAEEGVMVRARTQAFNLTNRSDITLDSLIITGANILLENATNCVIKNCRIWYGNHTIASTSAAFVGDASISMNDNSMNNRIYRNNIQWGSANGILLKGTGNQVDNNYIGNFNYLGSYGSPVELRGKNDLTRNEIFNAGRDGIRGGGDGSDCGYNDIHSTNLINDDCGAIYFCCGEYGGTRIHHNWIHDIQSRDDFFGSYKATGVYLDNTTENVVVDHNVMWNLEWACVQINWAGKDLLIYNNTLWSNNGPESSSMGRWVNGYDFDNVQVYNTLANEGEFHSTEEKNTVLMNLSDDPFVDRAQGDFSPVANSPAIDAGMVIPGYTDGFMGAAPDAGAYEQGLEVWKPGPDWTPAVWNVSNERKLNLASVNLYPNPIDSGFLRVEVDGFLPRELVLHTIEGKIIKREKVQQTSLNFALGNVPSGIYLLEIKGEEGSVLKKVIKQ